MLKSLKVKLTASYLGIMVLTISFLGGAFQQIMGINLSQSAEQEMLLQAKEMANAVGPQIAREGILPLERLITSEGRWSPSNILITDEEGAKLFSTKKVDPGMMTTIQNSIIRPALIERSPVRLTIEFKGESSVAVGVPIVVKGINQGVLILFKSIDDLHRTEYETLRTVLEAGLISGVLIIIISVILAGRMTKAIGEIGTVLGNIADGDLEARVNDPTDDEIGNLASNVNLMAGRLQILVDKLKNQEMYRKRFMADISHELRTPITTIRGFSEALMDRLFRSEDEQAKYYRLINRQAMYIEALTRDMLEFSKLENGMVEMKFEKLNLVELINSMKELFICSADRYEILFSVQLTASCIYVIGDAERIRQVINNFVDNAISFTKSGGRVVLSLEETEKEVRINISDNGMGIPEEQLAKVWERFYRGDRPRKEDYQGTGLGLPIARQIVQAHGGGVWVRSRLGLGSSFGFSLLKATD